MGRERLTLSQEVNSGEKGKSGFLECKPTALSHANHTISPKLGKQVSKHCYKQVLPPAKEVPKELPELPGKGHALLKTRGCMCMLKWHLLHLRPTDHYFRWMCLTLSTGISFEIWGGGEGIIQSAGMLLNFLVTTLSNFNKHKSFAQDNFDFVEPDCLLRKPF